MALVTVSVERLHACSIGRRMGQSAATAMALLVGALPALAQSIDGSVAIENGDTVRVGTGETLDVAGTLDVGRISDGTLLIEDGGLVNSNGGASTVGTEAGARGTVMVTGPGSAWRNDGTLYIGYFGDGAMTIADGGTVSNTVAGIGGDMDATGSVSVIGQGSVWSIDGGLFVGVMGDGALTVADGGVVALSGDMRNVQVAALEGSTGTVNIGAAAGGTARAAGTLSADRLSLGQGTGTLVFNHTGNADGSAYMFAPAVTGIGTIEHLAGRTVLTGSNTADSRFGGTMNIRGGSVFIDGVFGDIVGSMAVINVLADVELAGSGTVAGNVNITSGGRLGFGSGQSLDVSNILSVGRGGSGTLLIEDGGAVNSDIGHVGGAAGASGAATITGVGSIWTNGELAVGASGSGTLLIEDGGLVNSNGGASTVGTEAGARGTVMVTGPGSAWRNDGTLYIGYFGDGAMTIADGGTVSNTVAGIGGDMDATGSVSVIGQGSVWSIDGGLFVGVMGDGALTVADGGVVALSGDMRNVQVAALEGSTGTVNIGAAAGGTARAAGTLSADRLSLGQGTGTLVFNHTGNADGSAYMFAPAVTGIGTIEHLAGRTVLTGSNTADSRFGGTMNIRGGSVFIDGVFGDTVGNMAAVKVSSGGILYGTGTIAGDLSLSAGGVLSGRQGQTLSVNGDLTFETNSRFEVEVTPGGADRELVAVSGMATISGGTVAHVGITGAYDPTATYTLLTATGGLGIGSAFDHVTSDFAFLDATIGYEANRVTLTLTRDGTGFADLATTPNQIAVASGLEGLGFGNALYDAVVQLDKATAITAYDQLSGEVHASAVTSLIEDGSPVRHRVNERIRAAFGDAAASAAPGLADGYEGPAPVPVDGDQPGLTIWSNSYGRWGSTDDDGNAAAADRSSGGFLIGADTLLADQLRLGVLAGSSQTGIDVGARASAAVVDSYTLAVYGGAQWQLAEGLLSLRGGLAWSWHDLETTRSVGFTGFADSLSAGYDARTFQSFGELGYEFETDFARFEPFINLAHIHVGTDGFVESGGAAALTGASGAYGVTFTTLGIRTETAIDLGQVGARLSGMLGWRQALGDTVPRSTLALTGSDAVTIAGSPISRDALALDAGLDLDLTSSASVGLFYQGVFSSSARDDVFTAWLDVRF